MVDADETTSSRGRLLAAGKELFARVGYEQASTAAIARAAGTSESQLVRYFEGKAGLLDAIFNNSWAPLNDEIRRLVGAAPHAREAMLGVLSTVTRGFGSDHEIAFLFLFEGRRVRGDGAEVSLSKGGLDFIELVRALIRRGQQDGSFSPAFSDAALAAAIVGAAEGMIRERLISERAGKSRPFSDKEIRNVFSAILAGVESAPSPRPTDPGMSTAR